MRIAAALLCCSALLIGSCGESGGGEAQAYEIKSLDEAIGGPTADARVGDFILKNDKIIAAVEGGRRSRLFLDVGGTLIDADLVRTDEASRSGRGRDQLGQIAPVANLFTARALEKGDVRVTASKDGAEVTSAAEAGPLQSILTVLGVLLRRDYISPAYDYSNLRIYNEYEVRPGERLVRITTTVGHDLPFCPIKKGDKCNAECDDAIYDDDCECESIPDRCLPAEEVLTADALPDGEGRGLLDILLGDLPRPLGTGRCSSDQDCNAAAEETCAGLTTPLGGPSGVCRGPDKKDSGLAVGDMLLFGGNLGLFLPGPGYDSSSDLQRLFASGVDTLGSPLPFDFVVGVGKGVSYGYAAPGRTLVPIFGGSFSFGATGAKACLHSDPGCLAGKLVRFSRWVSVGEGDAASAREPLDRAKGVDLGDITGVVLRQSEGTPVSGAEVFAFKDPRDLSCDAACKKRCGKAPSESDIRGWTVEKLIAANKCRTVDTTFLQGLASLETSALTDVGLRPTKDGRYRMALPAGRYVLAAQDKKASTSPLATVMVEAGHTSKVSFAISRPGVLDYAIVDDFAKGSPGRVTVGACFPGEVCTGDSDCGDGETCMLGACACERTRLRPLELGGALLDDGSLAYDETASGRGQISLPAGEYEVMFSRGPHNTVDHASVTIEPGVTTHVDGSIFRAVDHAGWSATDFHIHQDPSLDSDLPMKDRVVSFLAEGMDFLSSSDHDILTQFAPLIREMKLTTELGTQVGVETSTQDIGHFLAWPLRYQEWKGGNRVDGNGAIDWRGLRPQEIFDELRTLRGSGPPVVVEVPHPYSYFDYYGLDPYTLEPSDSILSSINKLLTPAVFSGDFDTMEIMNGKNADLIRRPTIGELRFYSGSVDALQKKQREGKLTDAAYERALFSLSTEATRRFLYRTPAEQNAELAGLGNDVSCLCGADGDCAAGSKCDPERLVCVPKDAVVGDNAPPDDHMCRRFRGVVDDWFVMLNRGVLRPVVGGSDTHDLYGGEPGVPRTMIINHGNTPPYLGEENVRDAVLKGETVVTNGPMIDFTIDGAPLGSTVKPNKKGEVVLGIRVETAPWYDVDRIEVYRNGELIHWINGCGSKREDETSDGGEHDCIKPGGDSPVAWQEEIVDQPERDAWYVVLAFGIDGRTLAPIYSSSTQARIGTFEVAQKIFDLVPSLSGFRTPRSPVLYPTFPIGITNPIWVDVDGGGYEPLLPAPSWCVKGDLGCTN